MKKQPTTDSSRKLVKKLDKKLNKKKFNKAKMSKKKIMKKQQIIDKKINTKIELIILKIIEEMFTSLVFIFVFFSIGEVVKFFIELQLENKKANS